MPSMLQAAVRGELSTSEPCKLDYSGMFPVPAAWRWVALGEVAQVRSGIALKASDVGHIPIVYQGCVRDGRLDYSACRFVDEGFLPSTENLSFLVDGEVLLNSSGYTTLGRCAVYREEDSPYGPTLADRHLIIVRPAGVLSDYLRIVLSSPGFQTLMRNGSAGSSNRKSFGCDLVRNLTVPLPPEEEQKTIVCKIGRMMHLIQRMEDLEKRSTALRTEYEQILRTAVLGNHVKGRNRGGELVPEGWTKMRQGDAMAFVNGLQTSSRSLSRRGKYPVVTSSELDPGSQNLFTDDELDEGRYCVREDVLYVWTPSPNVRIWEGEKAVFAYHVWKVVPKECFSRRYLYYWLLADMEDAFSSGGRGACVKHMTKKAMEERQCLVPPLDKQEEISDRLDKIIPMIGRLFSRWPDSALIL